MTLTLLLDLDDTLLNTNLESFVPVYFQALAKHFAPHVPSDIMIRALLSSMRLMNDNEDFSLTLQQIFETNFFSEINISKDILEPVIENFYEHIFPTLSNVTSQKPEAKPFVDWAFSQGFRIAIATDPLMPTQAAYHRLRWAGFDPNQFELISTWDRFHFSKTHPAYYAEVLGNMGWPEGPVLMVGNDLERDIRPAQMLGLATFHVDDEPASSFATEAGGRGQLTDLRRWIESTDLAGLIPSFKSIDSVLGILSATPAALHGLTFGLDEFIWSHESAPNDWSLTEIICHLRDTELEINQMQINLFAQHSNPFIPRPDTSVWASQRDYLHEDGASALAQFNEARRETLRMLGQVLPERSAWENKARHAIFGRTNMLEVIGFMADHDRMHIQQVWDALKTLQF